jgi:hypothetical protein
MSSANGVLDLTEPQQPEAPSDLWGPRRPGLESRLATGPQADVKITSLIGKNIALLVGILTGLSTMAGVLWNLYEFAIATREKTKAAQVAQLTSYSTFGDLLTRSRRVAQQTEEFMQAYRKDRWDDQAILQAFLDASLEEYRTGASLYYAPRLADFREIRAFYEELGALLRFNAVDFEVVFQLITFPNDFYETTKPLQDFIRAHWFALRSDPAKHTLKDFGSNMRRLATNYDRRRANGGPLRSVQWDGPDPAEEKGEAQHAYVAR